MSENSFLTYRLDERPAIVIILTLLALFFFMALGGLLAAGIITATGVDVTSIINGKEARVLDLAERQGVRWFQFFVHLFSFVLVSVLIAYLAKGQKSIRSFLYLDQPASNKVVVYSVLLLIAALPLIQFSAWLNANLPLPSWMISMEESQNWLVSEVLRMESFSELLVALTIAALVPSFGEELLFRGVLQPQLQKLTNNPHWGIWLTAILFSAIHFQFVGFLPRMLLGALLGYALWWSGSLWLPMLIHLIFNGVQIIGAYLAPEEFKVAAETTDIEMPAIWLVLPSILVVGYLVRYLHQGRPTPGERAAAEEENIA